MKFILQSKPDNNTNVTIEFDEDSLPEVLEQIKNFLIASGYSYIENLDYNTDEE